MLLWVSLEVVPGADLRASHLLTHLILPATL